MAFKKFKDFVNIGKIKSDVQNTIDNKINDFMGDFNSSDLNPDNIESKMNELEGKMEEFEGIADKANNAVMAYEFFKNPKKAAMNYGIQFAKKAIEENEQVQQFKQQAIEKIKEKAMEIPQVQDIKQKADAFIEENTNIDIPSDLTSLAENPEKLISGLPSADALVEAAKRESGFARMLLRGGNK